MKTPRSSVRPSGYIEIRRLADEDASDAAKLAATEQGTALDGNLRWYGRHLPSYREINTSDGRGVRVLEPSN